MACRDKRFMYISCYPDEDIIEISLVRRSDESIFGRIRNAILALFDSEYRLSELELDREEVENLCDILYGFLDRHGTKKRMGLVRGDNDT